jgi:hypothetical protein
MSPDRNAPGTARPSAAINAEIRQLWESTGGRLTREQRRRYEQLVTEWAAAQRLEAARAPGHDEKAPALP